MIFEGIPVARIRGIEIRISLAWVALLAIVALLGSVQAGRAAPDLPAAGHWAVGVGVALAFLVSMLAHELAHALVSRSRGVEPGPVVLAFVGGLAPLDIEARRPRDELAIALAGPALSLVVGVACIVVTLPVAPGGPVAAIAGGVFTVGGLNLALALLSLVPGMPLDGGRVVRAVAWWRTGDRDRASAITAQVGQAAGWLLGGAGILIALAAAPAEGLVVLSLGWFLSSGARALRHRIAVQTLLRDVPVRDVMERDVPRLAPSLTLDTFADRLGGPGGPTSLPVTAEDAPLGVVGIRKLRGIGRAKWSTTRAGDVMATPPGAPFLAPGDPLWAALETLQRTGLDGLAVVADGRVEGMLTRRAATEAIRARLRARADA